MNERQIEVLRAKVNATMTAESLIIEYRYRIKKLKQLINNVDKTDLHIMEVVVKRYDTSSTIDADEIKSKDREGKTLLIDWIKSNQSMMSSRLYNQLRRQVRYGIDNHHNRIAKSFMVTDKYQYVEDLTKKEFMKLPNLGKTSYDEFAKLRGY